MSHIVLLPYPTGLGYMYPITAGVVPGRFGGGGGEAPPPRVDRERGSDSNQTHIRLTTHRN